jgi:hypothetical protein
MGENKRQTEPKLAGAEEPFLALYTGVSVIDSKLSILVEFFLPVVGGSDNDMTLFSIYGFGQFGAGWTLLLMESLRKGNRGRVLSL